MPAAFGEDRRRQKRVPLDEPCYLTLSMLGGFSCKAMLADLSLSGAQLGLPPSFGASELPGDSPVTLEDFPRPFEWLSGTGARVIWVSDARCGLRFNQELDLTQEELEDVLRRL